MCVRPALLAVCTCAATPATFRPRPDWRHSQAAQRLQPRTVSWLVEAWVRSPHTASPSCTATASSSAARRSPSATLARLMSLQRAACGWQVLALGATCSVCGAPQHAPTTLAAPGSALATAAHYGMLRSFASCMPQICSRPAILICFLRQYRRMVESAPQIHPDLSRSAFPLCM